MKQITILAAFAIAAFTLIPTNNLVAKNNKQTTRVAGTFANIEVKQYTTDNQYVYLEVQLKQTNAQAATLRITDEMGELLFVEKFNTEYHIRKVKLNPEELNKIELSLTNADGSISKKYNVAVKVISTAIVEEINGK